MQHREISPLSISDFGQVLCPHTIFYRTRIMSIMRVETFCEYPHVKEKGISKFVKKHSVDLEHTRPHCQCRNVIAGIVWCYRITVRLLKNHDVESK